MVPARGVKPRTYCSQVNVTILINQQLTAVFFIKYPDNTLVISVFLRGLFINTEIIPDTNVVYHL